MCGMASKGWTRVHDTESDVDLGFVRLRFPVAAGESIVLLRKGDLKPEAMYEVLSSIHWAEHFPPSEKEPNSDEELAWSHTLFVRPQGAHEEVKSVSISFGGQEMVVDFPKG